MGLFTKKEPCAICGGKVKGLLPWKIEGQYVCDSCHGVVDVQKDKEDMTMEQFRQYRAFREENQALKDQFTISQKVDFGAFDTKLVFDFDHRLFCMDQHLGKTVFRGGEIRSFVIQEDGAPIFEGGPQGLARYESVVPGHLTMMAPQLNQILMQKQLEDQLNVGRDPEHRPAPRFYDIPEPFKKFQVSIYVDHPYWSLLECDRSGPTFDNDYPDVNDYMNRYQEGYWLMENLAQCLMTVAFPDAPAEGAQQGAQQETQPAAAAAPAQDAVSQLKQYKQLLDDGVITQADFDAKKKQLMGL
ncbi:MAG: SHOCT domain-containing protein [Clostridia bacterium]|nr:SHOCT domain-containing protein [Clostridia bacterium]